MPDIQSIVWPGQSQAGTDGKVVGSRTSPREHIIAAATRIFSRKGYDGARVDEIAREAGLSKANLLYYCKSKKALYRLVIERVLNLWLDALGDIADDVNPAEAIRAYVNRKIELSRYYPEASRLFAMEVIGGAPVIGTHLTNHLRPWVADKGRVFERWQSEGRMARVDPAHAFFMIWAVTQTYADFEAQIQAVTGTSNYDADIYAATDGVVDALIRGLGLTDAPVRENIPKKQTSRVN